MFTVSGIVTLCMLPYSAPIKSGLQLRMLHYTYISYLVINEIHATDISRFCLTLASETKLCAFCRTPIVRYHFQNNRLLHHTLFYSNIFCISTL
jgi:hypothetical protein